MKMLRITLITLLIIGINNAVFSQKKETNTELQNPLSTEEIVMLKEGKHSPKKAMLYEMLLPGLGHIYNKKIWHIPITYGVFATTVYFIIDNTKKYKKYKDAYADFSIYNRYLNEPAQFPFPKQEPKSQRFRKVLNADFQSYSIDQREYFQNALKRNKDNFKKYRDLNYILLGASYVLNIVWTLVDAHLFYYDVSDDLSLYIHPNINVNPNWEKALALNIIINF